MTGPNGPGRTGRTGPRRPGRDLGWWGGDLWGDGDRFGDPDDPVSDPLVGPGDGLAMRIAAALVVFVLMALLGMILVGGFS